MRRLLAAATALLLLLALAACSDDADDATGTDDSAPGSASPVDSGVASDEFCATVEDNAELITTGTSDQDRATQAVEALEQIEAEAPEVIQPRIEVLQETFQGLADGTTTASDLLNAEFIGAVEQVAVFVLGECDLDLTTPSDAPEAGEGEVDPSALRSYVEAEDPELEQRIESISAVAGLEVNVTVRGLDVEEGDEGVGICEVVAGYVDDEVGDPGLTIRVQTTQTDDVANREGGGECAAA